MKESQKKDFKRKIRMQTSFFEENSAND